MSTLPAALPDEPTPAPSVDWASLPEDTRRWCIEQALRTDPPQTAQHIATVLVYGDQPVARHVAQPSGTMAEQVAEWRSHRGL